MSSREIARIAVCVALLTVSAWVSIPLGPVPFTLQTMVLALVPMVLSGKGALWAVGCYLLLGAIGLPVFSNMSGGLAMFAGPTGGFLWGFFIGTAAAVAVRAQKMLPAMVRTVLALVLLILCSYIAGTIQFALVSDSSPLAGLAVCVFPFVVPDIIKLACGCALGQAVRRALSARGTSMV